MFGRYLNKTKKFFLVIGETLRQRRRNKLAKIAELEKRDRKAVVESLARKFEDAYAECEARNEQNIEMLFSRKEIMFMQGNLNTWLRHFKQSEIYEARTKPKWRSQ